MYLIKIDPKYLLGKSYIFSDGDCYRNDVDHIIKIQENGNESNSGIDCEKCLKYLDGKTKDKRNNYFIK